MKMRTIKTRRLTLRPLRASDFAAWEWAYKNLLPKRSKWEWYPEKPVTRAEFRKILTRHSKFRKSDKCYVWAIFETKSGALIGQIDIAPSVRHPVHFANLGYFILNRYWKNGYGKEALLALIPHALRDLKLNRLEAFTDLNNRPSIALAKSIGLRSEGIRKKFYYQDGDWADQRTFAGTRFDFGVKKLNPK